MPPTRAAAAVTDGYRRRIITLRDSTALAVVDLLGGVDFDVTPASLARQLEQWRSRAEVLALGAGRQASEQAVAYLSAYLVTGGADPLSTSLDPAEPPRPALQVVRGALLWRLGQGAGRELAMLTATAAAKRITRGTVSAGATLTLRDGIRREPQIDGWHRVTSSTCCSRCAGLARYRYSDRDDFDAAHPGDRCTPEPTVLGRAEVLRRQSPTVVTP